MCQSIVWALAPSFLFPKLKSGMKRMRFGAISLIQLTVIRELKAIQEKHFFGYLISHVNDVSVPNQEGLQ
jgi:hypothetical protein